MKVILTQEVKNLGHKGEIKQVTDGYAAHFLFPKKLAVIATESALKEVKKILANQKKQAEAEHQLAIEAQKKLQGTEVVLTAKANEEGHLFGGIEAQAIAEALTAKGFKITEDQIEKREPIKNLGQHRVNVKISEGLVSEVKVEVRAEK